MYLPEDVKFIIDTLYEHGHEAYAVGGCVRDMMLGRTPGDWDITTSAMPEETKELFERTFDTGIEHGTITVLLNAVGYEVTTYRIDGAYEDSRHPSEVEFTRNLREDLQRRDFTINAMAYNDREGIVDIFEGMMDLEKKRIRCVGNAEERFGEDALRILRAIRFSAQLGFEIEQETCEGIQKLASTLENISVERIQVELVKMLTSKHPDYIDCAYRLGVTKVIFPEWDDLMEQGKGQRVLQSLHDTEADKMLRIATLLYPTDENVAKYILKRWKFDNETIKIVSKLVGFRTLNISADDWSVRKAMNHIGTELFPKYILTKRAEILGGFVESRDTDFVEAENNNFVEAENKNFVEAENNNLVEVENENLIQELEHLQQIEELYIEIVAKKQCTTLKQLAVTGSDLLQCGVKQGRQIGEVLQQLLELVIEKPECNTKEYLIAQVSQIVS